MSQDPNGTDWYARQQGDPAWPDQPRTVLRPADQSWRHPAQQDPGQQVPDHPQQPPGEPTAAWPPQWGTPQQPADQQPPPPPPVPPVQPGPPVQQGPPPGSVAWLQQHYPAPGERPPVQPDPGFGPQYPGQGQPGPPPFGEPVSAFAPRPPGAPAPEPPPAPPKRPSARAGLLIGGAAVLVALVVIVAMFFGKSPGGAAGEQDPRPSDAAVRFLEAVAAGDSARALSLQQQRPKDNVLLTDAVLRESRQRAPISRIRVSQETPTEVELTYQLGNAEARGRFVPVKQPDGSYKVDRGTTTVQITRPKSIPVLFNGVKIETNEVEAFPGTYEMSTGMPYITFTETQFTVSGPTSFPRLAPAVTLTDAGRAAMLDATRRALDACIAAKDLNPPNCPQQVGMPPNTRADNNTIRWQLLEDPLVNQVPKLSISDDTTAELRLSVKAKVALSVIMDGRTSNVGEQQFTFATRAVAPMTGNQVTARFVN